MHRCVSSVCLLRALRRHPQALPCCGALHVAPARCRSAAQAHPRAVVRLASAATTSGEEGAAADGHVATRPPAAAAAAVGHSAESRSEHAADTEASFASLGVAQPFVDFLRSQRIVKPSAVQVAAIPVLLRGVNTAIQAQTGSGKTLAYLLPVLTACFANDPEALVTGTRRGGGDQVLCLVVAPSQELAMQIVRTAQALVGPAARHLVAQCIGGANTARQLEALRKGKPAVVVGTPGRLAELSLLGHLRTHHVRWLILDEADELLAPVFLRHLARLGEHAGKAVPRAQPEGLTASSPRSGGGGRATVLVSATLAPATLSAYAPWCAAPEVVRPAREQGHAGRGDGDGDGDGTASAGDPPPALPSQLVHMYVRVGDSRMRVDALRRSIHALDAQRALVFLNFGRRLQDAAAKLGARGMPVGSLHGGQTKMERATTLQAFRQGKLRALLVTDLAARGLDVPECDAVFNLELPTDGTHYAHRAGRTARAGQPGICVTLVEAADEFVVRKFERALGVEIQEAKVGGGEFKPMAEVTNARVAGGGPGDALPTPPRSKPAGPGRVKVYKPRGAKRKAPAAAAAP